MISVDKIYLLQKKVESAVQKIEQLKSENDALRTKCSELTNALSEKTELLSSFMADGEKIESGIMSALGRLDSVENALLDNAMQNPAQGANAPDTINSKVQDIQNVASQESEPSLENDGFEFGEDTEERDSLFGDTSFETDDENPPQEIF